MEITDFTLRLFLLFFPGVIAYLVIENLTYLKNKTYFHILIYSLVLGFCSYFTYGLFLKLGQYFNPELNSEIIFFKALLDQSIKLDIYEIFTVSGVSFFLGLLLSFIKNKKYFFRFANVLRITKKFAEPDVWSYIFNSSDSTEWIIARDVQNNLMYEGWVEVFSDTYVENELFIKDVIVFNNTTGEELYRVPGLYISRKSDQLTIEFHQLEFSDKLERDTMNSKGDT